MILRFFAVCGDAYFYGVTSYSKLAHNHRAWRAFSYVDIEDSFLHSLNTFLRYYESRVISRIDNSSRIYKRLITLNNAISIIPLNLLNYSVRRFIRGSIFNANKGGLAGQFWMQSNSLEVTTGMMMG